MLRPLCYSNESSALEATLSGIHWVYKYDTEHPTSYKCLQVLAYFCFVPRSLLPLRAFCSQWDHCSLLPLVVFSRSPPPIVNECWLLGKMHPRWWTHSGFYRTTPSFLPFSLLCRYSSEFRYSDRDAGICMTLSEKIMWQHRVGCTTDCFCCFSCFQCIRESRSGELGDSNEKKKYDE